MIKDELIEIGLTENEAKTYLAALELGEATVVRIAKKSGVKRTTTYLSVETLKEKGFLTMLKKKKKTFFYAEDPRILQEKIEERKKAIDRIVPQLLSITNLIDKKPKITFYEGLEGIKDVYRDTLKYPDQELLAWLSNEEAAKTFDKEFVDEYYVPKRVSKKIWVRAMGQNTPAMQQYKAIDEKSLRQTKLISHNQFAIEVEINLYGKNKIGVMAFDEKIGLIIESQKIYNTLKSIFEVYWQMLG